MKALRINIQFKVLIFALLPITYFIISLVFKGQVGPDSLISGDPEYLYLYNGMSMGRLVFDIGHIDNPGTPLQVIFALTSRIVHLFSGEYDYAKDILARPDFYLNWFHRVNIFLFSATLFLLGLGIFKSTGKIFIGIFLQLVPFSNIDIIVTSLRVLPEMYTVIPLSLVIYFYFNYIYNNSVFLENEKRNMIILALIAGFGLSIKLNYLPFIFLPIFIFSEKKLVLTYFGIALLSFFLFAFPILWKLNTWWHWVEQLLFNSGVHGTGKSEIFDFSLMLPNLKKLTNHFKLNYILLAISIIFSIVLTLKRIKGYKSLKFDVLGGVVIALLLQTIMIIRSLILHYYIPTLFISCFLIVLLLEIIDFKKIYKQILYVIIGVSLLFAFNQELNKYKSKELITINKKAEVRDEVKHIVSGKPFVIIQQPYNFYFPESPLLFGWFFNTQKSREYCREILMELYPDTYIYDKSRDVFFLWGEKMKKEQIINNYKELYVFVDSRRQIDFDEVLLENTTYKKVDMVYMDEKTKDKVYRLDIK